MKSVPIFQVSLRAGADTTEGISPLKWNGDPNYESFSKLLKTPSAPGVVAEVTLLQTESNGFRSANLHNVNRARGECRHENNILGYMRRLGTLGEMGVSMPVFDRSRSG